jgi:hypothetical protein
MKLTRSEPIALLDTLASRVPALTVIPDGTLTITPPPEPEE